MTPEHQKACDEFSTTQVERLIEDHIVALQFLKTRDTLDPSILRDVFAEECVRTAHAATGDSDWRDEIMRLKGQAHERAALTEGQGELLAKIDRTLDLKRQAFNADSVEAAKAMGRFLNDEGNDGAH